MAQRPGCGLQAHGLADFDLKKAIEHYHGRGGGHSVRPEGRIEEQEQARWEPGGTPGSPLAPPHSLATPCGAASWRRRFSASAVFPRRIPNGKQGGGRAGDVRFWSKSLPPHHRRHLHGRRRAVASAASRGGCLAASLVLRVRVRRSRRRARRSPTFPKHNPRAISTPGGGGGGGTGRGREPGAQISTRILFAHPAPASDGAGRRVD